MARPNLAYVNGDIVPIEEAKVSVMDRGFLFGDGIYEVSAVLNGKLIDNRGHMARLKRSLGEISLASPIDLADLPAQMERLVEAEALQEGYIYLQITRGSAPKRDFPFPDAEQVPSTLVMFCQDAALLANPAAKTGIKVATMEEMRWARRDIKSTSLLAQVLMKQAAVEAGAQEAWMIEDGHVTEGGSSSAFIVTQDGTLVTRPPSRAILDSITARAAKKLAAEAQIKVEERLFTIEEAKLAREAFTASASALVLPIVTIDDDQVADGKPGPIATRLREIYLQMAQSEERDIAEWD